MDEYEYGSRQPTTGNPVQGILFLRIVLAGLHWNFKNTLFFGKNRLVSARALEPYIYPPPMYKLNFVRLLIITLLLKQ